MLFEGIDSCDANSLRRLIKILGRGYFETPSGTSVKALDQPLVVFTSFEEFELPRSFIQSCVVYTLSLPEDISTTKNYMLRWAKACFPNISSSIAEQAADLIISDRDSAKSVALVQPGLNDYLDLISTVTNLGNTEDEQRAYLERVHSVSVRTFGEKESIAFEKIQETTIKEVEQRPPAHHYSGGVGSINDALVYVSYSSDVDQDFVEGIYNSLIDSGFNAKIDRVDIRYRELISSYIDALGKGGAVIAIVNDSYIRSTYCMWELLKVYENKEFQSRLFPIVLPDAKISDGVGRLEYTEYWQEKLEKLTVAMQKVNPLSISTATIEEGKRIREFIDKVDLLTSMVADMNFKTISSFGKESMLSIEDSLNRQLESIGVTKNPHNRDRELLK